MLTFSYYALISLFIFICIVLMMLVLVQKGRGGGLASAFGGGGGHTPFGTKTGDVLTWATSILFGVFIVLAICLNWVSNKRQDVADREKTAMTAAAPGDNGGK